MERAANMMGSTFTIITGRETTPPDGDAAVDGVIAVALVSELSDTACGGDAVGSVEAVIAESIT